MLVQRTLVTVLLAVLTTFVGCGSGDPATPDLSIDNSTPAAPASPGVEPSVSPQQRTPVSQDALGSFTSSPATPNGPSIYEERGPQVRVKQWETNPHVVVSTDAGNITIELLGNASPVTVENFLNYVKQSFYENTIFHYVDSESMVIAGRFTDKFQEKEMLAPIRCESNNGMKNTRGTIAMLRQPDYIESATSEFFINLKDNPELDYVPKDDGSENGYCVFGRIITGMDVVDRIASTPVSNQNGLSNVPVTPVTIRSVTIRQ